MPKRLTGIGLLLLLCCLVLQGCVKANFTEPISQFQESINKSAAAVSTYYTGLNQFERARYLDSRLFDPKLTLAGRTTDEKGNVVNTPLYFKIFPPAGIKARTDSIVLIGEYAGLLGSLAGSEAPVLTGAAISKLGANLGNLSETFAALAKKDDPTAGKYAGPIGSIVGVFATRAMEMKREKLLEKAIKDGAPNVDEVLSFLEVDLNELILPIQTTGLKEALATRVVAYNTLVKKYKDDTERWSFEDRKKRLADIQEAALEYQLAIASNPANLIQSMRQANAALVKYAKSPKEPQDLAGLVAAVKTFKSQVETIVTAIDGMRSVGE